MILGCHFKEKKLLKAFPTPLSHEYHPSFSQNRYTSISLMGWCQHVSIEPRKTGVRFQRLQGFPCTSNLLLRKGNVFVCGEYHKYGSSEKANDPLALASVSPFSAQMDPRTDFLCICHPRGIVSINTCNPRRLKEGGNNNNSCASRPSQRHQKLRS